MAERPQSPLRFATETEKRPALLVPKPIDIVRVQTTATTVFTARDDADFRVESLIASNVTAGAVYVTVYLVPDGGTAGATNLAFYQLAVAAKSYVEIFNATRVGLLQPGMSIQALCGTNNDINMFGQGFDYQGIYG